MLVGVSFALCYVPNFTPLLHSEPGNTIPSFSILHQSLWGEWPLFHPFSLPSPTSVLHPILSHLSLPPPLFLPLKGPKLLECLSGEMKWHTIEKREKKEAFCCMAWNWIPMTSSALCNTNHSSAVEKGERLITFDGFTQWLLYPVVFKCNLCLIRWAD